MCYCYQEVTVIPCSYVRCYCCLPGKQANTKYSSIRTQYVKAKNKIEAETRSGAGSKSIKVWAYYDACMFLRDHVEVASQADSIHRSPLSDVTNDQSAEVGIHLMYFCSRPAILLISTTQEQKSLQSCNICSTYRHITLHYIQKS